MYLCPHIPCFIFSHVRLCFIHSIRYTFIMAPVNPTNDLVLEKYVQFATDFAEGVVVRLDYSMDDVIIASRGAGADGAVTTWAVKSPEEMLDLETAHQVVMVILY